MQLALLLTLSTLMRPQAASTPLSMRKFSERAPPASPAPAVATSLAPAPRASPAPSHFRSPMPAAAAAVMQPALTPTRTQMAGVELGSAAVPTRRFTAAGSPMPARSATVLGPEAPAPGATPRGFGAGLFGAATPNTVMLAAAVSGAVTPAPSVMAQMGANPPVASPARPAASAQSPSVQPVASGPAGQADSCSPAVASEHGKPQPAAAVAVPAVVDGRTLSTAHCALDAAAAADQNEALSLVAVMQHAADGQEQHKNSDVAGEQTRLLLLA